MEGRIVDNIKYIKTLYDNELKLNSLNEFLYYTLIDIFWNTEEFYIVETANHFNFLLVNKNIDGLIVFNDSLNDMYFLIKLNEYLSSLDETDFVFSEIPFEEGKYIEFDVWWKQLKDLIEIIENKKYITDLRA